MKTRFVDLVGLTIVQPQMRVGVMGNQRMQCDLRRNGQRKKRQQPAS